MARALNNNKVYSRFLGRVGAIGTINASDSDDGEPVFLLRLADGEVSAAAALAASLNRSSYSAARRLRRPAPDA